MLVFLFLFFSMKAWLTLFIDTYYKKKQGYSKFFSPNVNIDVTLYNQIQNVKMYGVSRLSQFFFVCRLSTYFLGMHCQLSTQYLAEKLCV